MAKQCLLSHSVCHERQTISLFKRFPRRGNEAIPMPKPFIGRQEPIPRPYELEFAVFLHVV